MFPLTIWEMLVRMALACVLGGVVGWEREVVQKPAGFRTHVLVCVGSALTMLISVFMYNRMQTVSAALPDPARLGAQVISGIGFLGAGTIIKEGPNIRGLTTAASLWAVACIGLAIGIGYYSAALASTAFVVIILDVFNRLEDTKIFAPKQTMRIAVSIKDQPGHLAILAQALGDMGVSINNIKIERYDGQDEVLVLLKLKMTENVTQQDIFNKLYDIKAVGKIEQI
ncbi:MgtC/SapB family protein [Mahella australiensis]|uniref:MgtC/SapB transporter n=1 Tax=Mahella australiensis (strain DSM 15567 / CIP 107919 / 50-1 BON) TaxID=697281 RepID=F3ZX28_MAHA5|nr:MgtC/SapB family protein [Mahella australiensis]AEE95477.1 MgtC/SapB transporter [Mahella australiensis 50-1 BON]